MVTMAGYDDEKRRLERLSRLQEIQVKLDWLIGATPTGEARNRLTEANILLNAAAGEPEFAGSKDPTPLLEGGV